jgi:transposase-like protein
MLQIHPNARTTPAVRAEIARSQESSGALAKRFGVSAETIRKWRKRGPAQGSPHSGLTLGDMKESSGWLLGDGMHRAEPMMVLF